LEDITLAKVEQLVDALFGASEAGITKHPDKDVKEDRDC
jgi:uncharacterized metal-binding protein